jgi:hypothetical protein
MSGIFTLEAPRERKAAVPLRRAVRIRPGEAIRCA